MLHTSFICLHALPDLSLFQFRVGYGELIRIRLRFTQWRSNIYNLTVEKHLTTKAFYPSIISEDDVAGILFTVIQAIEFYTDRFPQRVIRLPSGPLLQDTLFRVILQSREEWLSPLFTVGKEGRYRIFPFRRNAGDSAFLLKRRADPEPPPQPVRSSVNTRSRLFGSPVHVELHDDIDIGLPGAAVC